MLRWSHYPMCIHFPPNDCLKRTNNFRKDSNQWFEDVLGWIQGWPIHEAKWSSHFWQHGEGVPISACQFFYYCSFSFHSLDGKRKKETERKCGVEEPVELKYWRVAWSEAGTSPGSTIWHAASGGLGLHLFSNGNTCLSQQHRMLVIVNWEELKGLLVASILLETLEIFHSCVWVKSSRIKVNVNMSANVLVQANLWKPLWIANAVNGAKFCGPICSFGLNWWFAKAQGFAEIHSEREQKFSSVSGKHSDPQTYSPLVWSNLKVTFLSYFLFPDSYNERNHITLIQPLAREVIIVSL